MRHFLILGLLLICPTAFSQDPPQKYQKIWEQVNEDMEGFSKPVLKELKKLREENPNDPWIFWISGAHCNPVVGKKEAEAFFRQTIALDSTFPYAYYSLAIAIEGEGEQFLLEKIALYTKATIYDKTNGYSWLYRGDAWIELGEYDKAIADAEQARPYVENDPQAPDVRIIEALWKQGKKKEAFEIAKRVDFNAGMAMYGTSFNLLLASIYEELGDAKKACECYQRAAFDYEMMEEEMPAAITAGLKKCK